MLISVAEFATQRGVSPQAVRKAIKAGRLNRSVERKGPRNYVIDPEVAELEWSRNTEPQYQRSAEQINAGKARARGEDVEPPGPPPAGKGPAGTYASAKAAAEGYKAMLLKLDYEERTGRLVNAEDMKRVRFESGRRVRDAVLRIGPQMIGEIAKAAGGMTPDQRADVLLVIERHLVGALEALADGAGRR